MFLSERPRAKGVDVPGGERSYPADFDGRASAKKHSLGAGVQVSLQTTTGQPWIVLVEDDEALERELAGALERALPDIAVRRTPDADVALELVQDGRSCLLITEAHGKLVDGVALAACVRRQRPRLPLIFLSEERAAARAQLATFDGSHVVDKPPQLERLAALVARIVGASTGFRGELSSHDLTELVQLVALTMPTGALHLSAAEGSGTIWLDQGMIVHAATDGHQGATAFQRMLEWTRGSFQLDEHGVPPRRTITLTTTQLLLESARILDEEAVHGRLERSGTLPVLRSAAEHFERGLDAVHEKRYLDALPEWERAAESEPDNRVYQHNLKRLRELLSRDRKHGASGGTK
jgi:CheY-like chemotaxis protein